MFFHDSLLFRIIRVTLLLLQFSFLAPKVASAYSVMTHEAIIDSVWDTTFKPLLLKRFPNATPDDLRRAHAYAYGGALIQDMGYYPFGSKFFTDLVHYVRSGDFVVNLLNEAQDLSEYAFALGAFAHYWADNIGHPEGVNLAAPRIYPKLARKFGNIVTYEDDPNAHIKTEFGFDVLEVARGNFATQAYHDFIGFEVAKPVLERAFQDTYSIPLKTVFKDLDLALGSFRRSVSKWIPEATKIAWAEKKDEIQKTQHGMTARRFRYNLSRSAYHKEWSAKYQEPGVGARFLAFLLRLMPHVGPFRALAFKMPTPDTEAMFMKSFNDTVARVRSFAPEVERGGVKLSDLNYDDGKPTRQGEYRKADDAYAKLLDTYSDDHVQPTEAMRANIIAFYQDPLKITDPKALTELNVLKAASAGGSQ